VPFARRPYSLIEKLPYLLVGEKGKLLARGGAEEPGEENKDLGVIEAIHCADVEVWNIPQRP
jgi:hypothetical protein